MPTMAGFLGISLLITYLMKLNLNPMSYRLGVMFTGLSIGYIYSDFKSNFA